MDYVVGPAVYLDEGCKTRDYTDGMMQVQSMGTITKFGMMSMCL
jgi:hypothetical protein